MILSIWRYRAAEGRAAEFEQVYGPEGDWAKLFVRAPGYLGTELLRSADGDYVTLDRWQDRRSWDEFKSAFGDEYAALDAACEVLTVQEESLGMFEGIDPC